MIKQIARWAGAVGLLGLALPAHAIILFNGDNSTNLTDPGTGAPWGSVAKVSNGSNTMGSAVYLGDGYMLTANHVGLSGCVTFDGATFYAVDNGFTAVQVAANVDMKIFRLTDTAIPVAAVNLWNQNTDTLGAATIVGWGIGRAADSPPGSNTVNWDGSTAAKRWGLNDVQESASVSFQSGSYQALITVLGSSSGLPPGVGDNEAAVTQFDSGGALFQDISGTWYLTGLATGTDQSNVSTFGNDATIGLHGDFNYFAEIGPYQGEIMSVMVPEPGECALAAGMMALGVVGWRRAKREDRR